MILQAFGPIGSVTQHRCHVANGSDAIIRAEGTDRNQTSKVYKVMDCPGIDNPASSSHFPIIETLLSVPFSVLHNLPRLVGMFPISKHQKKLITMGSKIIELWYRDPSPEDLEENGLQNNAWNTHKPLHVHHESRIGTKFLNMELTTTFGTMKMSSSSCHPNQDVDSFELASGQILLGNPFVLWDGDGLLLTPMDEELVELGERGIHAGAIDLSVPSEPWDAQTMDNDDWDDIDALDTISQDVEHIVDFSSTCSWLEKVADLDSTLEPPPLIHGPFKAGVIGNQSVNDILMTKGLIDPLVYIQFLDLNVFSCSCL